MHGTKDPLVGLLRALWGAQGMAGLRRRRPRWQSCWGRWKLLRMLPRCQAAAPAAGGVWPLLPLPAMAVGPMCAWHVARGRGWGAPARRLRGYVPAAGGRTSIGRHIFQSIAWILADKQGLCITGGTKLPPVFSTGAGLMTLATVTFRLWVTRKD